MQQSERTKRQAELNNMDDLNQLVREYQYLQETSGARRTQALEAAMREKYLSGRK